MKRIWTVLLAACLLLPCAARGVEVRDASGVIESDGWLRGDIVGVSAESGETALALRVDCPLPPDFLPEQLAVITTEWIVPDASAVGDAMRETGAHWRDADLKRFSPAFVSGSASPLSPLPRRRQRGERRRRTHAGQRHRACLCGGLRAWGRTGSKRPASGG